MVVSGGTAVVIGVVVDDVVVDGEPHLLRFATTQTYVLLDRGRSYLAGQTAPLDSGDQVQLGRGRIAHSRTRSIRLRSISALATAAGGLRHPRAARRA